MKSFIQFLEPLNKWLWSFLCKRHLILFCSSDAPDMPDPIDPGKSMGAYLFGKKAFKSSQGVTDPVLQGRLLESESTFRPLYTALELADIQTMAQGRTEEVVNPAYEGVQRNISSLEERLAEVDEDGNRVLTGRKRRNALERQRKLERTLESISPTLAPQAGLFDLLEDQSRRAGELQREQLGLQREADVAALREYAPQVVEAYREADPYSTRLADLAQQQAETLYAEAEGELSPERRRIAEQAARQASLARGRIGDESSIAAEVLGREQFRSGLRAEARQAGAGAFGQQRQMAGDVGMTILGRPSSAIGLGSQMLGQAQAGAAGPMGPQLFDPNVGINMAMQQQANQASLMGAQAQAGASRSAGTMQALGTIGSAAIMAMCWVAREVYGVDNPKWLQFREWMLEDSPSWFRSLYIKYGERFAKFISNKPLLKTIIRKWMNTRIK